MDYAGPQGACLGFLFLWKHMSLYLLVDSKHQVGMIRLNFKLFLFGVWSIFGRGQDNFMQAVMAIPQKCR